VRHCNGGTQGSLSRSLRDHKGRAFLRPWKNRLRSRRSRSASFVAWNSLQLVTMCRRRARRTKFARSGVGRVRSCPNRGIRACHVASVLSLRVGRVSGPRQLVAPWPRCSKLSTGWQLPAVDWYAHHAELTHCASINIRRRDLFLSVRVHVRFMKNVNITVSALS